MTDYAGYYDKYKVSRTDGRDGRGDKHERCKLFVLDLTHDAAARSAALAYASLVSAERPRLARDLRFIVERLEAEGGQP